MQTKPCRRTARGWQLLFFCVIGATHWVLAAAPDPSPQGNAILEATDLSGGLVVHLGCGDGRLTAALRPTAAYVVQGLDVTDDAVMAARRYVEKQGLYGPVSVERWDGRSLPYAADIVNLIVISPGGADGADEAELQRVLAPGGTIWRLQADRVGAPLSRKPWPKDIDDWTHYLHGADGNPVARDSVVAPPTRLRWSAAPRYTWSHEYTPGIAALVSAGGRIFYVADGAPAAAVDHEPRWQVLARDAFNGVQLWERQVAAWYPYMINWGQVPPTLQRRLVATARRLYVPLGLHAPVSALDAASGETLHVFDDTDGAEELLYHDGVLLVVVRTVTDDRKIQLQTWAELAAKRRSAVHKRDTALPLVKQFKTADQKAPRRLLAFDAESGRRLWEKAQNEVAGLHHLSICADNGRAVYQCGGTIHCLDLKEGRELWQTNAPVLRMLTPDAVVCAGGDNVAVVDLADGKVRWQRAAPLTQTRDAFVIGDALWLGGFQPFQGRSSGKRGPAWGPYFLTQLSLTDGKKRREIAEENPGHHHRCYSSKATERYLLGGRRGTEFVDLATGEVRWNSWARGVCKYGVMPSNGLLYVPPHACACYVAAKLTGFNALAPTGEAPTPSLPVVPERGPAFTATSSKAGAPSPTPTDWPTYRGNAARSGATSSPVPATLKPLWQSPIGGRLSALTVAENRVFAASPETHRVLALDAATGQVIWRFTAGARIDSPPTVCGETAIFGAHDGWLYCLRMTDGALVWRRRTTPIQRRIPVRGQLESAWPVPGSVLLHDGQIYCTAGRSSYLDGGIVLCRIAPDSGRELARTTIYSPDPETGRQPPHSAPAVMPGARADLLSAHGNHVYLRDLAFDSTGLKTIPTAPHLLTLTDFLDGSWPHRSYWIFGTTCSVATGCSRRDPKLTYGRLLVFDTNTVYGYGRRSVHWSNQFEDGTYRLFARPRGGGEFRWQKPMPLRVRAMLLAGKRLFLAGPPAADGGKPQDARPLLLTVSANDGSILARRELPSPPVFDGLAAARQRLYVAMENGQILCLAGAASH